MVYFNNICSFMKWHENKWKCLASLIKVNIIYINFLKWILNNGFWLYGLFNFSSYWDLFINFCSWGYETIQYDFIISNIAKTMFSNINSLWILFRIMRYSFVSTKAKALSMTNFNCSLCFSEFFKLRIRNFERIIIVANHKLFFNFSWTLLWKLYFC